jgi:polar amino acid transport system substrate-binding protein
MPATPLSTVLSTPAAVTPGPSPLGPGGIAGDLVRDGALVICSAFPRARFAERDANGKPFGVDIEIGQAIAGELVLQPDVQERPFESLIDAVTDGQCDVSVAGQFITQSRLERIEMIPYRQGTQHVVVRAGNPLAIVELTDLCGRALAVVAGTIHVDLTRGLGDYAGSGIDHQCSRDGLPAVDLREYPSQKEAEDALARGDVDAYIGNDFVTVDRPADFSLSAALPTTRNGIGHRKGTLVLGPALVAGLRALIDDGTYLQILEKYDVAHAALTIRP